MLHYIYFKKRRIRRTKIESFEKEPDASSSSDRILLLRLLPSLFKHETGSRGRFGLSVGLFDGMLESFLTVRKHVYYITTEHIKGVVMLGGNRLRWNGTPGKFSCRTQAHDCRIIAPQTTLIRIDVVPHCTSSVRIEIQKTSIVIHTR